MAKEGKIAQIRKKIIEILQEYPYLLNVEIQGRMLCDRVEAALSDIKPSRSTISVQIRELAKEDNAIIRVKKRDDKEKRSYYFYSWENSDKQATPGENSQKKQGNTRKEKDFEEHFADFLVDRKECSRGEAYPCGDKNKFSKWSNPDVIGVFKYERGNYDFSDEIVAAEIKAVQNEFKILEGFGQACAYLIFSHKVYLVIPKGMPTDFQERLESMCRLVGLGLAVFDHKRTNLDKGIFNINVWARRHEPNMWYVNEVVDKLIKSLKNETLKKPSAKKKRRK